MLEDLSIWFNRFKKAGLLGFCIALFELFLVQIGETGAYSRIEESLESQEELIFFQDINQELFEIKYKSIQKIKPDVIVVGKSRVNMFRAKMFEPYTFYNLSNSFNDFSKIIGLINSFDSTYCPKYLFIPVEAYQFVLGYSFGKREMTKKEINFERRSLRLFEVLMKFNARFIQSPNWNNIGIKAVFQQRGFRTLDGSAYWGKALNNTVEKQKKKFEVLNKNLSKIAKKGIFMNYESDLIESTFLEYEALIKVAREKDITVIAFTAPYSSLVQKMLDSDTIKYKTWHEFQKPSTSERLNALGDFYFNFSRFDSIGSTNYEMLDLMHPSERIVSRMLLKMFENKNLRKRLPLVNTVEIQERIKNNELPISDIFSDKD